MFRFPGASTQAGIGLAFGAQENTGFFLNAEGKSYTGVGRSLMNRKQRVQQCCKPGLSSVDRGNPCKYSVNGGIETSLQFKLNAADWNIHAPQAMTPGQFELNQRNVARQKSAINRLHCDISGLK